MKLLKENSGIVVLFRSLNTCNTYTMISRIGHLELFFYQWPRSCPQLSVIFPSLDRDLHIKDFFGILKGCKGSEGIQ